MCEKKPNNLITFELWSTDFTFFQNEFLPKSYLKTDLVKNTKIQLSMLYKKIIFKQNENG